MSEYLFQGRILDIMRFRLREKKRHTIARKEIMTTDLWHSSSCTSCICLAPVSSSQWIFKTTGNGFGFDGKLKIYILPIINTLGRA